MKAWNVVSLTILLAIVGCTTTWQNMYGGSDGDSAWSIQQTSDGGYIVAGPSYSTDIPGVTNHGGADCYIIKLNSYGNIKWQNMYGGSSSDEAWSIRQTADGGYIAAGVSNSTDIPGVTNHGEGDYYIIKLDPDGNIEWQDMYGGSGWDCAVSIQQSSDGGYIVAGMSYSTDIPGVPNHGELDYYIIKLDPDGNIEWQDMYGGSGEDLAASIQQTSDGGYIVAGGSESTDIPGVTNHGGSDYYIIKLDPDGDIEWQDMYGGSDGDSAYCIQQTTDGGYIVAGYSYSTDIPGVTNHGDRDCYIIKLDPDGNIEWQDMYGGSVEDWARSIQQTADGGYIAAGVSNSTDIPGVTNHGWSDYYIIKLDPDGDIEWQDMYGGSGWDSAHCIQQTSDGEYIVAGHSYSTDIPGVTNHGYRDYYIIKLDENGEL